MTTSQNDFTAAQYAARAQDYVASATHALGPDLEQIETALAGQNLARVLDLGCGGGHVSYRAAPHAVEVIAYDLTQTMLDAVAESATARGLRNIRTVQGPAENLPFEANYFDAVLCRFTAHHWQNFEAGLREARRVLKPAGLAIFIDTIAPANPALDSHLQAIELLRDSSHIRNFSAPEWVAALTRAGFSIQSITPRKLWLDFATWTARTRTPDLHIQAIRALQQTGPATVRDYFQIAPDGSFNLDSVTFEARSA